MSSIGLIIGMFLIVVILGGAAAYIYFNATSQIGNLQTILSKYGISPNAISGDVKNVSSQLKSDIASIDSITSTSLNVTQPGSAGTANIDNVVVLNKFDILTNDANGNKYTWRLVNGSSTDSSKAGQLCLSIVSPDSTTKNILCVDPLTTIVS